MTFIEVIKVLRPYHWLKNLLLIAPTIASKQMPAAEDIWRLFFAILAFTLVASATYLFNDIRDISFDSKHPEKQKRLLASGGFPKSLAAASSFSLALLGIVLAINIGLSFLLSLITYLIISILYTVALKRVVVLDCLVLSFLYLIRIFAGSLVASINLSFWFMLFSIFFFTSLAFLKRYSEALLLSKDFHKLDHLDGRGYLISDTPILLSLGLAFGISSIALFSLHLESKLIITEQTSILGIYFLIFTLLFWMSWMWFKSFRGELEYDPVIFALKNPLSLATLVTFLTCFLILPF